MKKIFLNIALLLAFVAGASAQQFIGDDAVVDSMAKAQQEAQQAIVNDPETAFTVGNKQYSEEQYGLAITTYESILLSGQVSSKLYFNLGNAYYKSGDIPRAILNYERAKLLSPNDEDINFNIELCNQNVVDEIEALPRPFFVVWYNSIININNSDEWAYIGIGAFILLLITFLGYVFAPRMSIKKISFSLAILFLVITAATLTFAGTQKSRATNQISAIIFNPTVTVKASPDDGGTALFVVHQGLKVSVLETIGNWYKIRLADGHVGWIKKEVVEMI